MLALVGYKRQRCAFLVCSRFISCRSTSTIDDILSKYDLFIYI